MRYADAAGSHYAAITPDMAAEIDTPLDVLKESFATYDGAIPATRAAFVATCIAILDSSAHILRDAEHSSGTRSDAAVAVLSLLAGDSDRRLALRAVCYQRLLGIEGRTLEQIGVEFGLCRAAVHTVYRQIQNQHPFLHSRGDRSDSTRRASAKRRIGFRKPAFKWTLANLWTKPLPIN